MYMEEKRQQLKVERKKEEIKLLRFRLKIYLYLSVTPYFLAVFFLVFGGDKTTRFEVMEPTDYLYFAGVMLWFICFFSLSIIANKKVQNKIEELR